MSADDLIRRGDVLEILGRITSHHNYAAAQEIRKLPAAPHAAAALRLARAVNPVAMADGWWMCPICLGRWASTERHMRDCALAEFREREKTDEAE